MDVGVGVTTREINRDRRLTVVLIRQLRIIYHVGRIPLVFQEFALALFLILQMEILCHVGRVPAACRERRMLVVPLRHPVMSPACGIPVVYRRRRECRQRCEAPSQLHAAWAVQLPGRRPETHKEHIKTSPPRALILPLKLIIDHPESRLTNCQQWPRDSPGTCIWRQQKISPLRLGLLSLLIPEPGGIVWAQCRENRSPGQYSSSGTFVLL